MIFVATFSPSRLAGWSLIPGSSERKTARQVLVTRPGGGAIPSSPPTEQQAMEDKLLLCS